MEITGQRRFRDQRRQALIDDPGYVGLDDLSARYVGEAEGSAQDEWLLHLDFIPSVRAGELAASESLSPENFIFLEGEAPANDIRILAIEKADGPHRINLRILREYLDKEDDRDGLVRYTLRLHGAEKIGLKVDRFFNEIDFMFRHEFAEKSYFPKTDERDAPRSDQIDYLTKDYAGFLYQMNDHMAHRVPKWRERNPADLGVTVLEALAYTGDLLSYYQDAVATEAYLSTARRRVSVRRHLRLIDYHLHEGCNARCWVQIKISSKKFMAGEVETGSLELPAGSEVLAYSGRLPTCFARGSVHHRQALESGTLVFQTMEPVTLRPDHNRLWIYTWGARNFKLQAGSTIAALRGHHALRRGDVLLFEWRGSRDPNQERNEIKDPRRRQVVRLSKEPVFNFDLSMPDPRGTGGGMAEVPITEIEWFPEDALREDYPVATTVGQDIERDLTIVRSNIVLVDHGESYEEMLDPVPEEGQYRPGLERIDLTRSVPFDPEQARTRPAREATVQDPHRAQTEILLYEMSPRDVPLLRTPWRPRFDLLSSPRFAKDFVPEEDDRRRVYLRFGDDSLGAAPAPGTRLKAVYRTGRGTAGNVGPYAIRHLVLPLPLLQSFDDAKGWEIFEVKNHLPGEGGVASEKSDHGRVYAPQALHSEQSRQRCVTEEDFAVITARHESVRRAVARRTWNGTRYVAEVYVQLQQGRRLDDDLIRRLRDFLRPHLLIGWDVMIFPPRLVPLDIRVTIWVEPEASLRSLERRLRTVGSDSRGPGLDFLDPDYFTFGQPVYISEIIAQTMEIPGVAEVALEVFRRWGESTRGLPKNTRLDLDPLEIASIRNDPTRPHRGIFQVTLASSEPGK